MSKELKDVAVNVMEKIHSGQVKMKPRIFFIIGSVLTFIGLVSSIVTSVFLVALTRFFLRSHGPMGEYRLDQLISNFPFWVPIIAIFFLMMGIRFLRYYDFSYKKNFVLIIFWFVLSIFAVGWIFDMTGLNDIWLRRGPMKGIMRQYLQEKNMQFNVENILK